MSIVDARQLAEPVEIRADVCIVGAGAAGITLATELARAGRDVCLVESGGFTPEEETQQLYDLTSMGYPVRECFMSRARYFGGSCNLWAGRSMRLEEADVAGSSGTGEAVWPIAYAELDAYYPRAAAILRLPTVDRFAWERWAPAMADAERRLFGADPLRPTVSLWARYPMRFGAAYRSSLRGSSRIRVVLHANVTSIRLERGGRAVRALEAATLSGRQVTFRAAAYVLACGGLENARLLLVSRDVRSTGVGNEFDVVGRYLMDHPRAVFGRVRLDPDVRLALTGGRPFREGKVQLGIGIDVSTRRREGLLNHYATLEPAVSDYAGAAYQSFVQTMKVLLRRGYTGQRWDVGRARFGHIQDMVYLLTPKEIVPHFVYRGYTSIRDTVRPLTGGERVVVYFCEQPPDQASRVTLSYERDHLGMNKLILDWRIPAAVTRDVLRLQELLRERLTLAGVGRLEQGEGTPRFTDASHHMGTTRMAVNPRAGVVDTECRVHGVANLFVAGSAVFPSAGHANPTLTIIALTLRLAKHLGRVVAGDGGDCR